MQYKPHKKYRHTLVVGGILLAITLSFVLFANMGWGYLWLNQLGTIGTLTALIYLAIRYILNEYVYFLPENGGIFEVKRISGRLPYTIVSIGISSADCILPYSKEAKKAHQLARVENCTVSLMPEESYLYICVIDGKKVGLHIECKEDFVKLLEKAIENASAQSNTGEDE